MNKKILIIDDEPDMVQPVTDRLEFLWGTDSFIYTQYFDEAMATLQQQEILCISIDLIMPADSSLQFHDSLINGINALRQIRGKYASIPVACYTVVKEEDIIQAIRSYQAEYISKNDQDGFYQLMNFYKKNYGKK